MCRKSVTLTCKEWLVVDFVPVNGFRVTDITDLPFLRDYQHFTLITGIGDNIAGNNVKILLILKCTPINVNV